MSIPPEDVAAVRAWCDARVPTSWRHELRIDCVVGDRDLTIVERRAPLPLPGATNWASAAVAMLRCSADGRVWTLYRRDRGVGFERYEFLSPVTDVRRLLQEIESDPAGMFWG